MARGSSGREIKYRRNHYPAKFGFGRKVQSDYGKWTYEGRLAKDDYGALYDPRYETPDLDLGSGVSTSRGA